MAPEQGDRDAALRAKLVAQVLAPERRSTSAVREHPGRLYGGLVTAAVLIVVVALSVTALRFVADRGRPAVSGSSPVPTFDPAATELPIPAQTLPAGKLLGRFTSEDGADQDHTIQVNGLGIATQFICVGEGTYSVWVAGGTGESGDGDCDTGAGVGAGNGVKTTATVRIRTQPGMRWTYTLIGIPPQKRVTLKPVLNPTDDTGARVAYCTSTDLSARYAAIPDPDDNGYSASGELVFTNRTDRTCALAGFPEVRFLSNGSPLGHNTMNQFDRRGSTEHGIKAVIVKPGAAAYSQVSWYLPGGNSRFEGPCVARAVTAVEVGLRSDYTAPSQTGTLSVPIGDATACLNGEHGALGKYGQISSTVFLDYSKQPAD